MTDKQNDNTDNTLDKDPDDKLNDSLNENQQPDKGPESRRGFFPFFKKSTRAVRQSSAGAGFVGLIGFGVMLAIASVFFVTENYFISMFTISIGLFIYVTGLDLVILAFSTFIIFFSSKQLTT